MNLIALSKKSLPGRLQAAPIARSAAAIAATLVVGACAPTVTQNADDTHNSQQGREVKVMIVSMFGPEGKVWLDHLGPWKAIKVPGLSPDYPDVQCNAQDICVMTTGMGHANAAASLMALTFSDRFDLHRIDARDARDHEASPAQVEAIGERERHQRCGCVRMSHAGRHHADILSIALHVGIVRRESRHLDGLPRAEMVEPDLSFGAEHRDDHDLHFAALLAVVNVVGVLVTVGAHAPTTSVAAIATALRQSAPLASGLGDSSSTARSDSSGGFVRLETSSVSGDYRFDNNVQDEGLSRRFRCGLQAVNWPNRSQRHEAPDAMKTRTRLIATIPVVLAGVALLFMPLPQRTAFDTRIVTVAQIQRPATVVFDYVTTPAHWPTWHPSSLGVSGAVDHSLDIGEQATEEFRVAAGADAPCGRSSQGSGRGSGRSREPSAAGGRAPSRTR